jgi:O-antigen/teichoic acid export membrane protein
MKRIHYVNAFSGIVQVAANIVLTFIIVPVFVKKLGFPTYGIYALITAIGNLGVFTNFGFNTTVIKYLAEQKDRKESNYDIVVPFIVIGGMAFLVACASLVFREYVLFRIMNIPSGSVDSSVYLFYVSCVISNVFLIFGQVPSAVLDSQQRVYVTNGIQLSVGVGSKLMILGSLFIAPSLSWIGVITMVSSATSMMLLAWFAVKTWGTMSVPGLSSRFLPVVHKHLAYGRTIYATSIMEFFYQPVTKILISHYLGLTEVGFFDMALKVKGVVLSFTERLLYPVLPLFASKESNADARNLHDEVQRKLVVIVIPVILAITFISKPAFSLWLGATLWPVIVSVVCIVNCFLIAQLYVPLYQYLLVKGYPEKTLVMQCANVSVNIVLFVFCVPALGYYGAVLAFCAAMFASIGLAGWYQWTEFKGTLVASNEFALKLVKLSVGLLAVNGISTWLVQDNLPRMVLLVIANVAGTVLLYRVLKMVSQSDIEQYVGRNSRAGIMMERLLVGEMS